MITFPSKSYNDLRSKIRDTFVNSLKRIEEERVHTYWKTGWLIATYIENRSAYGEKVVVRLAEDLNIERSILIRAIQFYKQFPKLNKKAIGAHGHLLGWGHYRALLPVKNDKERLNLVRQAEKEGWTQPQLIERVRGIKETPHPSPLPKGARKNGKLSIPQGKLYTYRVFKDKCAEDFLIDLGFNIYREAENKNLKGGFVETVKTGNTFNEYKTLKSNANEKHLYTFKAYPKKIIDGDTLWVMIDCGFKTWVKQKIRLRGIDTPEVETPEGKKALSFVTKALKGLPFIVIKCHKRDKYDRYLSDVFYLRGEQDPALVFKNGNFINQELLDNGLARTI